MTRGTVIHRIENDNLDCLRSSLTRGDSRIILMDPESHVSPSDVREFLSRLGCDEYELNENESAQLEIDPSIHPDTDCLILSRAANFGGRPRPGITNQMFRDDHGPTTDFNLRLVNLGHLQIHGRMTVWDVGAGTGSVSIESARLNPSARYYAIESQPERVETLEDNIRRMGTYNVRPIEGMAPAVFDELPGPDRVFIGGTLGQLDDIMAGVHEVLNKEGMIVANFLRMKFIHDALSFLKKRNYDTQLIQLMTHESRDRDPRDIEWQEGPAFPLLIARKRAVGD